MLGTTETTTETTTEKTTDVKRREADQLFNIAERPVMEFISEFLEEPISVLFKDDLPAYTEPLILLPFAEYKDNICIKFTLKPITERSPAQKLFIDSIIAHPKVKEGIGFLLYCVKEVYNTITVTMINNKLLANTIMELNEDDWVLYSKYANPLTTKKIFLEDTLSRLTYIKQHIDKFPPDMVEQINMEFPRVIEQLKLVSAALTPEIVAEEKAINDTYLNKPVLGIFVEEINESELPPQNMASSNTTALNNTLQNNQENNTQEKNTQEKNTQEKNTQEKNTYNIETKTAELFL